MARNVLFAERRRGAAMLPVMMRLSVPLLVLVIVTGSTPARSCSDAAQAPAPPNEAAVAAMVKNADSHLAETRRARERAILRHEQGVASTGEVAEAEIAFAEARFQKAAIQKQDEEARAALEAVVAQRERLLRLVTERATAGVASTGEVNAARIALAEARLRLELHTLVTIRQQELTRTQTAYEAGAVSQKEVEAARQALETARRRVEVSDTFRSASAD